GWRRPKPPARRAGWRTAPRSADGSRRLRARSQPDECFSYERAVAPEELEPQHVAPGVERIAEVIEGHQQEVSRTQGGVGGCTLRFELEDFEANLGGPEGHA